MLHNDYLSTTHTSSPSTHLTHLISPHTSHYTHPHTSSPLHTPHTTHLLTLHTLHYTLQVDDFFSLQETTLTRPQTQASPSSGQPKPVPQSPSNQRSSMTPSLLQPSHTSSGVGLTETFDADFGPIEWSSANQPLGGGGAQPLGGGGAQQWSNVGATRSASSSGQSYMQVGEGPPSGQAGQLFSGMETRPPPPLAAGHTSTHLSSSVLQTGQMYMPAITQATGVRGGQQMESSYQQQPAPRPGSTVRQQVVSSGFGQPVLPAPVQSSTPQQAQVTNPPMGWSSGVSTQSSTPQQAQVTNPPMGWSSGVSTQSSIPQQAQVTNPPMGWSSGVSIQSFTPQQAQVTNPPMGWSGQQQSSNPLAWSSAIGPNMTPLLPTQGAVPSAQTQQWPTTGAQSQQWPAAQRPLPSSTRDNPFADFLA